MIEYVPLMKSDDPPTTFTQTLNSLKLVIYFVSLKITAFDPNFSQNCTLLVLAMNMCGSESDSFILLLLKILLK